MTTGPMDTSGQNAPSSDALEQAYPGQFDQIPLFPPRRPAPEGIPDWLRQAPPEWYRTEVGPVLHVAGERDLVVRSVEGGWTVSFDGVETSVSTFGDLLEALESVGAHLVQTFPKQAEDGQPKVISSLEPGFAADLLWWCTDEVVPSINGIVFEDWFGAPATYRDTYDSQQSVVWELVDELHWEIENGYSMTGSYGTMSVWRIGARYLGDTGDESILGAYTGPEAAIEFFRHYTSPDDWERYGLLEDEEDGESVEHTGGTGDSGDEGAGS